MVFSTYILAVLVTLPAHVRRGYAIGFVCQSVSPVKIFKSEGLNDFQN